MLKGRKFKVWAYTVSHKTLFLRSEIQLEDLEYDTNYNPNCTIDIEFSGVDYMEIESEFILVSIQEKTSYKRPEKEYELKHNKGTSIIRAKSCLIGKSEWIDQHRIDDISLAYPEILKIN